MKGGEDPSTVDTPTIALPRAVTPTPQLAHPPLTPHPSALDAPLPPFLATDEQPLAKNTQIFLLFYNFSQAF